VPETVKIPVMVPCVSEVSGAPELRWETLAPTTASSEQVKALLLDYFALKDDDTLIRAILERCRRVE